MSNKLDFSNRLREFFYYPKLSRHTDLVSDVNSFTAFLNEPSSRRDPYSLYVHVPFCDYLCHFCPFMKVLNQATPPELKKRFFDAMVQELRMLGESAYLEGRTLEWVEFGGGTPTSVEPEYMERVLQTIHESFPLKKDAVITMEGDALTLARREKLELLHSLGVNRVSYGVQTFKEELRRKLGLKPTVEDLRRAAEMIREVGIAEFAIDILYNLPDQSQETLDDDITKGLELAPDYIDFYPLTLWENTTFKARVEEGRAYTHLPSNEQNLAMFRQIASRMADIGWRPARSYTFVAPAHHEFIEVSQNRLRQRGEALGVGPSSRAFVGRRHSINTSSITDYVNMLEAGTLPVELGALCSPEEEAHRLMVLFPAMLLEIDLQDIPFYEPLFAPLVADLVESGHVWNNGKRIGLTESGMLWAGNVSREFFSPAQKARMTDSFLYAVRTKVNPYNQDATGVRKGAKAHK
ncbi:coproporphyrinogen III oxidase [Streptomyces xanthochromogenes]|uniref:coproporphyrinogen-III oxidase family protein n=1 Tax=Streptomyces xanthochromogenes TaxID=67384 RepID=UPI0016784BD4|nr:coproporphyrinogen-III oxidase family protein [Streptomyces xanthochromogenes]GHB72317.1 coproporphyrinogen III oxidase [Streptomyces xanthochromogenes]